MLTRSVESRFRRGVTNLATSDYTINSLPANIEAERSILGAILLDNFACSWVTGYVCVAEFH